MPNGVQVRAPDGIMSRVIGAGLGYLLGGLAVLAVWLFWLRKGRALSARRVDHIYGRAQAAPARLKWTYAGWSSSRLSEPAEPGRAAFWMWLPLTLFAPVLALVLIASAVAEFRR
jgi:hypothetical protein